MSRSSSDMDVESEWSDSSFPDEPLSDDSSEGEMSEEEKELKEPLDKVQLAALKKALKGDNFFITGGAGTGKSFLLKRIIEDLKRDTNRRVLIMAPTGLAASQYDGGRTLHSVVYAKGENRKELLNASNQKPLTLIIDEVSMVSSTLLDELHRVVYDVDRGVSSSASVKKVKVTWPNYIQLILVGDFFQLPPIPPKNFNEVNFACDSTLWGDLHLKTNTIVLSQPHRQSDEGEVGFVSLLNRIRIGICTRSDIEMLKERTEKINSSEYDNDILHIYCTNEKANDENDQRLQEALKEDIGNASEYQLRSYKLGKTAASENDMMKLRSLLKQVLNISGRLSTEKQKKARNGIFQHTLKLVKGCVVMVTVNVDVSAGIVNGLRGTVTDMDDDTITIQPFDQNKPKVKIHRIQRRWGDMYVEQFPLRLAWAISVHKAQGLTVGKGMVDLSDAFAFGQAYTALSRFKRLDDLILRSGGVHPGRVWAHPKVLKYYDIEGSRPTSNEALMPEITAVADIVGDPCILRGVLKGTVRKNKYGKSTGSRYIFNLHCSTIANIPQSIISVYITESMQKNVKIDQIHEVKVKEFIRHNFKQNSMPIPGGNLYKTKPYPHKFHCNKVEVKYLSETDSPDEHKLDEIFINGPFDTKLNSHCRVSVQGSVGKVDEKRNEIVLIVSSSESDEDSKSVKIQIRQDNGPMARHALLKGREYFFSNILSCGSGKPLHVDAVTHVTVRKKRSRKQTNRLLSVSPAIYELAQEANVFSEILHCPGDVSNTFVSPLHLLSTGTSAETGTGAYEDEESAADPFVKASEEVERVVSDFFRSVQEAVDNNLPAPDGNQLVAPEIPHLRLGSSCGLGPKFGVGSNLAKKAAENLFNILKGYKDQNDCSIGFSSQMKFILLEIFCEGFGNDMMNDFFAFNMFEYILNFNDEVSKKHRDRLQAAGLEVQTKTGKELIESFETMIRKEDWEHWCEFANDRYQDLLGGEFEVPFDTKEENIVIFVPRHLVSSRPSSLRGQISTLRDDANNLLTKRLQITDRHEAFSNFFKDAEAVSEIEMTRVSIVVGNEEIAKNLAGGGTEVRTGLYVKQLRLDDMPNPVCCVIGDVESFMNYHAAVRPLVLAFVEVEMPSTSSIGCHATKELVDSRNRKGPTAESLPIISAENMNSATLLSDWYVTDSSQYSQKQGKQTTTLLDPTPSFWAIDKNMRCQIGRLFTRHSKDCTWLMWAVNRPRNDQSNPAKIIFDQLGKLPLRGPKACFDNLLSECEVSSSSTGATAVTSIRIGTFNMCNIGKGKKNSHFLVDDVIIHHKLSVVALQEVRVPFLGENSDAESGSCDFRSYAEGKRDNKTYLQVFGASEPTGIGNTYEYPSILIDEKVVEPAGDRWSTSWHGYVKNHSLTFDSDPDNPLPYARVPYFWRLRVKKNNATFVVVSVHLVPGNKYYTDAMRQKSMKNLLTFINERWPREDVFIMGDFNIYDTKVFQDKMLKKCSLKLQTFKTLLPTDETTNLNRTEPYDHIVVRDNDRFKDASPAVVIDLKKLVKHVHDNASGTGSKAIKDELKPLLTASETKQLNLYKKVLSDHCPIYVEYDAWTQNKTLFKP